MTPTTAITRGITALERSGRAFELIAKWQHNSDGKGEDPDLMAFAREMTAAAADLRELQQKIQQFVETKRSEP